MSHWHFMCYRTEDGLDLVQCWYMNLDEDAQALFDSIWKILEGTENLNNRKDFLPLKRKHDGLWEVRFTIDRVVRYRPVGFFTLNYRQFIMVLGCQKAGGIYQPITAFDEAWEYRRIFLEEGRGSIHERNF